MVLQADSSVNHDSIVLMPSVPLHPALRNTPVDRSAPFAPAVLDGAEWRVVRCPYCGQEHRHGAGDDGDDPRRWLGGRVPHCDAEPLPSAWNGIAEYHLVAIEILGPLRPSDLDRLFPFVQRTAFGRLAPESIE